LGGKLRAENVRRINFGSETARKTSGWKHRGTAGGERRAEDGELEDGGLKGAVRKVGSRRRRVGLPAVHRLDVQAVVRVPHPGNAGSPRRVAAARGRAASRVVGARFRRWQNLAHFRFVCRVSYQYV